MRLDGGTVLLGVFWSRTGTSLMKSERFFFCSQQLLGELNEVTTNDNDLFSFSER